MYVARKLISHILCEEFKKAAVAVQPLGAARKVTLHQPDDDGEQFPPMLPGVQPLGQTGE